MGEDTGDANGSAKQSISERITNWGVSDDTIENVIDLILAFVLLCLLMTVCFFTLTVRRHIITILMVPLLTYFILGSAGFRLRMKERRSRLIFPDLCAVLNLLGLSLYMDNVFYTADPNYLLEIAVGLVGVGAFSGYLCRSRSMYRGIVPLAMAVDAFALYTCGAGVVLNVMVPLLVPVPFAYCMAGYSIYFGYGRVVIDGKYEPRTEKQAAIIRKRQAEEKREKQKALEQQWKETRKQKKSSR